jgi:LPS sulfotransferase NodH
MSTYDSYIICATPRTGSTLLCGLLAATGIAGKPDSFFRRQTITWWAGHLNVTVPETAPAAQFNRAYLDAVLREGDGETGMFGLRLMMENVGELSDRLDTLYPGLASDGARFEKAFGNPLYIHLARTDKVAQAVSLAKAMQTGLWHIAPDGTEIERMSPPQTPGYDHRLLEQHVAEFECFEQAWKRWFERHRINPVQVEYEALSANPQPVLASILDHLGLDVAAASGVVPDVAKLADEDSLEWIKRYNAAH